MPLNSRSEAALQAIFLQILRVDHLITYLG